MNTALFTARVHGREQPCTRSTAVFTVRTRLCTRAVNTPVYRVHSRTQPCTGHGRTMYMAVHDPNTAVFTAVYAVDHGVYGPCTPRHNAYQASQKQSRQQKFVGRLLLKCNNSFSRNWLVYVFGSRDLLGHNVGHVMAHAQLTLWTILFDSFLWLTV